MDVGEYMLFIPLLIYGMALSRLLGEWRRFFDLANWHGPYLITVVVFTEVAVWNVYTYLGVFGQWEMGAYVSYLAVLVAPFVFLLSVNALLKDDNFDGLIDRGEFAERIRLTYFFMACFIALHLLPRYRADDGQLWYRLPALAVVCAVAWLRDERLIYLLGVVWVASLAHRLQLGM